MAVSKDLESTRSPQREAILAAPGAIPPELGGATLPPGGDRLGHSAPTDFQVIKALGKGGMGLVELAIQPTLDREVAIKRLRPEVVSPQTQQALLQEARAAGKLEHPNIVPVHLIDFGDEGRPRLVMKCLEGVAWRELIRHPEHPAWAQYRGPRLNHHLNVLLQVCNAVEYAHSRKVLHRDIKPANVMVGSFGEVYLVDWGIAVDLTSPVRDPELAGSPAYLAPEMLEGAVRVDERTDVYLLGACLHEVLTGASPHTSQGLEATLEKVRRSEPFVFDAQVPAELAAIRNHAMHVDMAKRPASVAAFRHEIEDFVRHQGSMLLAREAERQMLDLKEQLKGPLDARATVAFRAKGMESRFGFRQALKTWPENKAASEGLRQCLELLVEFELAHDNAGGAESLLAELASPPAGLQERLQTLLQRSREGEKAKAELAELAYQHSVGKEWRRRSRIIGVGNYLTALLILALDQGRKAAGVPIDAALLCKGLVGLAIWVWVVLLFGQKTLEETQTNRQFLNGVKALFTVIAVNHIAGTVWEEPPARTLVHSWLLSILYIAVAGVSFNRAYWVFLPGAVLCLALTVLYPDELLRVGALHHLISGSIFTFSWRLVFLWKPFWSKAQPR